MKVSRALLILAVFHALCLFWAVVVLFEEAGTGAVPYNVGYACGTGFMLWLYLWMRKKVRAMEESDAKKPID